MAESSFILCLPDRKKLEEDFRKFLRARDPDAIMRIEGGPVLYTVLFSAQEDVLKAWELRMRTLFATCLFSDRSLHEAVHQTLLSEQKTLALAESCTGGALSARLVSLSGASHYFLGSLVVYSNAWKREFLGVSSSVEAVSEEAVRQMVLGLFTRTKTDYAIAVSGILGPEGGTVQTPVGTVYLALAKRGEFFDAGKIVAPPRREEGIEYAVQMALALFWRRVVHQVAAFV